MKVLLAHRADPWRDALERSLRGEGVDLELTRDGNRVLEFLSRSGSDAGLLISGPGLQSLSGPDAIYRAFESRCQAPTKILLVTEVRADAEMLDLWRKRGVTDFLYPDASAQESMHRVLHAIHGDSRSEARILTRVPAKLKIGDSAFEGTITNLSRRGAEVTFHARPITRFPSIGEAVVIDAEGARAPFAVSGVIRRATRKAGWFRERRVLGVQLAPTSPEVAAEIDATIESERARAAAMGSAMNSSRGSRW